MLVYGNTSSLKHILENNNSIKYVAIELDDNSVNKLKDLFSNNNPWNDENSIKIICHHSTIAFGKQVDSIIDWINENNEKPINLEAYALGYDNKACAVKVKTKEEVPYQRKIPHITLATNLTNKGKPVDSNNIVDWKLINTILLTGKIKIYYN